MVGRWLGQRIRVKKCFRRLFLTYQLRLRYSPRRQPAKKNDTKGNTKKTVAQKIKKAVLGNTGATVGGVAVFAVIALLGFAGITVLRKRA